MCLSNTETKNDNLNLKMENLAKSLYEVSETQETRDGGAGCFP